MGNVLAGCALLVATMLFGLHELPRALSEREQAGEFVHAPDLQMTDAECTNYNGIMLHYCEITYRAGEDAQSHALVDWAFGRANERQIHLLQWRDDPSVVTTDMSLDTMGGRLTFMVAV